ncbi:MAG: hypothetical protein JJU28_12310 [Cyclobacteriaceae bacterium]|nr:hypothetical protein [Cyclobacteriaceae bacterium]
MMPEEQENNTPKLGIPGYINQLRSWAYISLAIPLLSFFWIYLKWSSENQLRQHVETDLEKWLVGTGAVVSVLFISFGIISHKRKLNKARSLASISDKMRCYKNAKKSMYIYFPLAALIATAAFYFTAHAIFAAIFSIVLVLYSAFNPSPDRLIRETRASKEDAARVMSEIMGPGHG